MSSPESLSIPSPNNRLPSLEARQNTPCIFRFIFTYIQKSSMHVLYQSGILIRVTEVSPLSQRNSFSLPVYLEVRILASTKGSILVSRSKFCFTLDVRASIKFLHHPKLLFVCLEF